MTNIYKLQPSFAGGEISPALWGRQDLAKYGVSLKRCENFVIHPHGGVTKRPGLKYVAQTKYNTGNVRLVEFQYSLEQSYVLEFGQARIRFFKNGEPIMSGSEPYEINTPYYDSEIPELNFTQSADVLYIVHGNHAPRELARISDNEWELKTIVFNHGPFEDFPPVQDALLKITQKEGVTINFESDKDVFKASDAGRFISFTYFSDASVYRTEFYNNKIFHLTADHDINIETNGFWSGTVKVYRIEKNTIDGVATEETHLIRSYYSPKSKNGAGKNLADTIEVTEKTSFKVETDDFEAWVPEGNTDADRGYFIFTIREGFSHCTAFLNTYVNPRKMEGYFYIGGDSPASSSAYNKYIREWSLSAWDEVNGYPSTVAFYQERLCFGNTKKQPQTLWWSKTGDYYNFEVSSPVKDDDAVSATLVSRKISGIRYLISLSKLIALTSDAEWMIGSGNNTSVLTPSNISPNVQGYRGAAQLEPIVVGDIILYLESQGSHVRDLGYDFASDSYTGSDLTILANHLFRGRKIVDWAYQQEPDGLVWCVMDDGSLISLTYLRDQNVIAWARHPLSGKVESAAAVKTPEGDVVYLVIKRSNGVRTVEILEDRLINRTSDGIFVDGAVVREGSNITTVTGLEHLEGLKVKVVGDGMVLSDQTVSGGRITLNRGYSKVVVGVLYKSVLETLDIALNAQDGTQVGRKLRVVSVNLRLENATAVKVRSQNGEIEAHKDRSTEHYGAPNRLFTGVIEYKLLSDFNEGRIEVISDDPLPASILGIAPVISRVSTAG